MPKASIKLTMSVIDRLARRVWLLVHGEEGMALPFALLAMVASTALASAAILASVDVQQGSHRDSDSKSAIAAADAGDSVALMRLNRYAGALSSASTANCLGINAEGKAVVTGGAVNGWCPAVTGTVGSSAYSYRTSAMVPGGAMSIVATGTIGGVSRRVLISLAGKSLNGVFSAEGLIGREGITLSGNVKGIRVSMGTDGNVTSSGNVEICGNVRHGVGKKWTKSGNVKVNCGGIETEGNVELPPVSSFIPADIATNNSDFRLEKCISPNVPAGCGTDTYNGTIWNPKTRTLSASGQTTVTLGGGDYWLCSLSLSGGSHLIMAAEAHVRLFFDTPENCGTTSQVSISGNSNIEATKYGEGNFDMPGIYLLGSPTIKTSVSLSGTSNTNELVLYGPYTDVTLSGTSNYKGIIAGRTLTSSGTGEFTQDAGFEPPLIGGATLYSRQSYVECSGPAISSPSENC